MASKPLRPCKHPGCPELTREGWCPTHKPKYRRGASAEYHGWYLLPIWKNHLRPDHLVIEPFCRECASRGIRTTAMVVDHVRPFRGDWVLFTDRDNLQSLCKRCHDRKTLAENRKSFR